MGNWAEHLRPRLARLRLSPEREAEIIEELSEHLDQRYDELRREGAEEAHACRLAMEELLDPGTLAEQMRSLRQAHVVAPITPGAPRRLLLADLWQDLRYALRMLNRQRAFVAAAVLTLALGIGANSAIFALVDATLLRPLPFSEPDRLVKVWERTGSTPRSSVSPLNLRDWTEHTQTFQGMAAFVNNVGGMVLGGEDGTAETIPRQWVSAGVFDVLGVPPLVGRTFLPSDDRERANVVVLSEGFWRTRFNADRGVVGRDLRLDGTPYTVVGVVPQEAQLLGRTAIWALGLYSLPDTPPPAARSAYVFHVIGRLKPGVSLEAANADLAAIADTLAREFPDTNTGRGVTIEPLDAAVIGRDLRQTSLLFLGVVGFVLLICCANVANLLLTRATVRQRELALRSVLGADRWRVMRQLVTESLLLSVIGGAIGIAIGMAILNMAPAIVPPDLLPPAVTLAFDLRVLAFCAATALFVGLVFGLAPAWQATRVSFTQAIASESRTVTGRGGRVRGLLVIGQVATAVILLFGAGLLLRTLLNVERVDRGYGAESVLSMIVDPLGRSYPTAASRLQFYESVEQEVRQLPGVRDVGWATTVPLGFSYQGDWFAEIVGAPPPPGGQAPVADYQIVSPTYFSTLAVPIVEGRGFDQRDTADSVPVALVNEAFVRRHLPGRSPIGVRVSLRPVAAPLEERAVREIVGVVRQVKGRPDETEDFLQIYVPLAQDTPGDIFMLVRPVSGSASALTSSVRGAIAQVDREQLVSVRNVMTLDAVAAEATARYRFRAVLVITFATLALVLAMIGVFGVLAYTVEQRVRDFGVRRALGATTGDVLRVVVASATRLVATGAVVGLLLSVLLGRLLATMLFGVQPLDTLTFVAVAVVLALTAAVSIAGPAWRVTRVDPVTALRAE